MVINIRAIEEVETIDDRNVRILALWGEKKSAGDIAKELGLSRSAVMGVIDRYKKSGKVTKHDPSATQRAANSPRRIGFSSPPQTPEQAEALRQQRAEERKATIARVNEARAKYPPPTVRYAADEDEELDGVSILNARPGQCRWIQDQRTREGLAVFCAAAVVPEKSYCPHHHRICTTRPYGAAR